MIYVYTDQYQETLTITDKESDDPAGRLMFATDLNNMEDFYT